MLDIEKIRIDGDTQARESLNEAIVAEYADAYLSGAQMPPVTVFYDGSAWWLADGFHRYHGAKAAGLTSIYEDVTPGTRRDAQRYSLGANGHHGLRRTAADKRLAVEKALRDPEWSQLSDRALAELCAVSAPFVGAIRRPETAERQQQARAAHAVKVGEGCNPITPAAPPPANSTPANSREIQPPAHAGLGPTATESAASLSSPLAAPAPATAADGEPPLPPPAAASAQASAPQADSAAPEEYAPSEEEIAAAQAAAEADAEALQRLLQSDEPLGDALRTVKQLRAELAAVKSTRDGYMTQCNEQISRIKSLQRQVDKLKKELEAAHGSV